MEDQTEKMYVLYIAPNTVTTRWVGNLFYKAGIRPAKLVEAENYEGADQIKSLDMIALGSEEFGGVPMLLGNSRKLDWNRSGRWDKGSVFLGVVKTAQSA